MSDDVKLTEYESAPRSKRRIEGVDLERIDERLAECSEFFHKHVDETDYRNIDWYLQRANLRFAAGDDIYDVLDDYFMAARCLHDRHAMHLDLKPPEMFFTRRILPVELGIISGMPMLTLEFSATYGLPLMMVISKTAPPDLLSEACLFSTYFRSSLVGDFYELAGLSAVFYAGVIAAIGRGFDDEAVLALNTYAKARDSLRGNPPAAALAKIKRYDALNTALACLCNGNFELIGEILAPVAEDFLEENRKKAGEEEFLAPSKSPAPKYFDSAILTILALVALREKSIIFPETGALSQYRDFERGFTEMPERRIEIPGLDEEARRILQEAGIDPDAIESQGSTDTSFRDEKEESEARALALLQERQRAAQEAVRLKMLERDEEDVEEIKVDSYVNEPLKLREEDNEEELRTKKKTDFSQFFEEDEELPPEFEDEQVTEPVKASKAKDFSSFFENDDADDLESRERAEIQDRASEDRGESYADFFDKLDEAAIPKFDDGSEDALDGKKLDFSAKFFDAENDSPAFKMSLEDQKDSAASDDSAETLKSSQNLEKDYTKLFSTETKHETGLKMQLDPEDEVEEAVEAKKVQPTIERDTSHLVSQDEVQTRDYNKIFDEDEPVPSDLKMSEDPKPLESYKKVELPSPVLQEVEEEIEVKSAKDFSKIFDEKEAFPSDLKMSDRGDYDPLQNPALESSSHEDEPLAEPQASTNFSNFFDELEAIELPQSKSDEEELRELAAYQEKKRQQEALETAALKLELLPEDLDEEQKPESAQERLARLISERDAEARELAQKEREQQMREIAQLAAEGPRDLGLEKLKLKHDPSTDPDEVIEKVQVEDMQIAPYAYTDLDMIHENTAILQEQEEDITVHELLSNAAEPQSHEHTNAENEDDDSLLIAINYDGNNDEEKTP